MISISYCPCTLEKLESSKPTFSPAGLRLLFDRKPVSPMLDLDAPSLNPAVAEQLRQNSQGISISGAQFKQSMRLEKGRLRFTEPNESGTYILKPIQAGAPFGLVEELPANEHLTMQLARQVYKIRTAECGLVFFRNGEPAYLTRRFDVAKDGYKTGQEDFAALSGRSKELNGDDFRNQGSYEDMARLMKKYVPAYPVEVERFFSLVVFNYLFSNGDAHLKNFSLQQTASGDHVLSPAYDLINTLIHLPNDTFFGLKDGLFSDDFSTPSFEAQGFYAYDDFYQFGLRIGMQEKRLRRILAAFQEDKPIVHQLVSRSFLSVAVQHRYLELYQTRRNRLCNSLADKK